MSEQNEWLKEKIGLTLEEIRALRERDTAKPLVFDKKHYEAHFEY